MISTHVTIPCEVDKGAVSRDFVLFQNLQNVFGLTETVNNGLVLRLIPLQRPKLLIIVSSHKLIGSQ